MKKHFLTFITRLANLDEISGTQIKDITIISNYIFFLPAFEVSNIAKSFKSGIQKLGGMIFVGSKIEISGSLSLLIKYHSCVIKSFSVFSNQFVYSITHFPSIITVKLNI